GPRVATRLDRRSAPRVSAARGPGHGGEAAPAGNKLQHFPPVQVVLMRRHENLPPNILRASGPVILSAVGAKDLLFGEDVADGGATPDAARHGVRAVSLGVPGGR